MAKSCKTCNHNDVCEYCGNSFTKNRECSHWQALRYTGQWIKIEDGFKCSECGVEACAQFSYCPDCGASMMYKVL